MKVTSSQNAGAEISQVSILGTGLHQEGSENTISFEIEGMPAVMVNLSKEELRRLTQRLISFLLD